MFEFITDEEERGQVGIGTLIVFIAMVLVAAIAAGVLVNTAGFLQSKAQETGQQSSKQVSNRLQEVATVGNVTEDGSGPYIDAVNVTVTQAPGAGEIDLENATVTWIGPDGTFLLNHANASQSVDDSFDTSEIKNVDGSPTVLDDPDDRLSINFDLSSGSDQPSVLEEGDEVTIKINTRAGSTTTIRFTVPESLGQQQGVEL
ncbi:archaellin/type IV pilin N-terminal domain-containing protein [Halobaculum limi]|uniref:archaellin/type IV pilin N-terminal domain-containing protein n=1 Tax=Halobaculum limi TaxID=3031916 RepID=UPI002406BB69|nr:archaellin/type IV pilin N-terminal domain-containing protein [Halobaculum sp. YSMS11]